MDEKRDNHPRHIRVSPDARQAIARLKSRHAEIMFHVTLGCCDAGSPLCLEAGELRLGSRDVLIGLADGVPVYAMIVGDDAPCPRDYILDVIPGTSVGFSLEAGFGIRFTLREAQTRQFWQTAVTSAFGANNDDGHGTEAQQRG
jgi:uncharacterized protein (DUF779 family)